MAVANTKSTAITNADARNPRIESQNWIQKGGLYTAVATVEVAAADDNGSVYRMVRVPSGARIDSVEIMSDAITAGTVYDIGLYNAAHRLAGAVVDADFFAANVDLSAGNTVPVEVTFGNALDIDDIEKRLWEALSLTSDPQVDYDICVTGDTVGTGAGTISLRVRYTI